MSHGSPFSNNVDTGEATQLLKDILNLDRRGIEEPEDLNNSKYDNNEEEEAMDESMEGTIISKEIVFTDNEDIFAHEIQEDVKVICNSKDHSSGSSKMKIHNIVNFNWKEKYYVGRLVAVHVSGHYLAYTITVKNQGNVRVVKLTTHRRDLITSFLGQVKDLSFSHSTDEILLACVDEYGSFSVHRIIEDSDEFVCHCILSVKNSRDSSPSDYHMVVWCPYIPEEGDLMDSVNNVTKLLAVTNDYEVAVWDVESAEEKYGGKTLLSEDVPVRRIADHSKPITAAAFSPDGIAFATASCDGEVKFFEVNVQDKDSTPSCLHQWKPHDGKPVSCLFFLDNVKSPQPEVLFWKCALTGADHNRELKLWSCETWNCLQTIRFESVEGEQPCMKVELDASASYLLLSDIIQRVVYVLQLNQVNNNGNVRVCSVAKFPVIFPVLSVAIVDAKICKFQLLGDLDQYQKHDVGEQNGDDEVHDDMPVVRGVALKLFWISTRSVQECCITYQPPVLLSSKSDDSLSLLSQSSIAYRDQLSDLSCDIQDLLTNDGEPRKNSFHVTPLSQFPQNLMDTSEVLLTPDDFTSPTHANSSTSTILTPSTPSEEAKASPLEQKLNLQKPIEPPLATSEEIPLALRKSSQRSSFSSPSREVEDILSPVNAVKESVAERNGSFTNSSLSHVETETEKDMKSLSLNCQDISAPPPSARKSGDFAAWPLAPDLNKDYKLVSQKLDTNHLDSDAIAMFQPQGVHETGDTIATNTSHNKKFSTVDEWMESVNQTMSSLVGMIHQHGSQMQIMQENLKKHQQQENAIQLLVQSVESMDKKLSANMDVLFADHSDFTKMKAFFAERDVEERKWLEKHANSVSQNVSMAATNKMEKTIKSEMKTSLLPQMKHSLDTWKDSMQQDMSNRMAATEVIIRDSMSKLVKNKALIDPIAQSVGSCIQPQLHLMCQEVFINKFVPTIERVCQNLYLQMNDTFKQGINEYLQQTKSVMEQFAMQCQKSLMESLCSQFEEQNKKTNDMQESFRQALANTTNAQIELLLQEAFAKQNELLVAKMKSAISEEMKLSAVQQHQFMDGSLSSISSRAVTPVPHVDPQLFQQQIMQYLKLGQYNIAFQKALSAADLSLVMYVCQSVRPEEVFGASAHPLKPPVLLSLIHQLGTDLTSQTDLKLRYLQAALVALDTTNPLAKDHLPNVLQPLRQRLTIYLQNPKSTNLTAVKMLLMAIQSLSSSFS